jgi:hypothetical protein
VLARADAAARAGRGGGSGLGDRAAPDYRGDEVLVDRTPVVVHLAIPGYGPVSQLRSAGGGETAWSLAVARQKVHGRAAVRAGESGLRGATLRIGPTDGVERRRRSCRTLEAPPAWTVTLTSGGLAWST